jgi:hypothetical protein
LWAEGKLPEGKLLVENRGGTLTVTLEGAQGHVTGLYLEGPTELLQVWELDMA